MTERTKSALVVVVAALVAALIYVYARRPPPPTPAVGSATASASASAPAPPREASRSEVEHAIGVLEGSVRAPASDARSPWALAHGLIAFGPELVASDGKPAVAVIGRFAELRGTPPRYGFPKSKDGQPVAPHPALLVKTLLDVGVPLERELQTADGSKATLARLASDLHEATSIPETDAAWHDLGWALDALVARHLQQPGADPKAVDVGELAKAALTRLETDDQVVTGYAGDPAHAFDEGSPLYAAKRDKTGIYGHSCGGLHLVQAVLGASRLPNGPDRPRLQRQLGVLLFRYDAEREAYASMLAAHPEHGLLLRVQQLKFFGHLLETLGLARSLGLYDANTQGGARIDRVTRQAAADVVDVVASLDAGGVYLRLDAIRSDREQTYLDLVGDGCHALRGLRRALQVY